jgi:hypothetical protein
MARQVMAMVKTTYLQMFAHAQRPLQPPRDGLAVVHAKKPPATHYLLFKVLAFWLYLRWLPMLKSCHPG